MKRRLANEDTRWQAHEKSPTLAAMGEVQIKATLRNHYTPTRTAQIKRAAPRSSDQDAEQLGPSPTAGRMYNGRVWQFLSKLNMQLPCHLASELLGMSPTDTQKFRKTGTQLIVAALFITAPAGRGVKPSVGQPYPGVLLSCKRSRLSRDLYLGWISRELHQVRKFQSQKVIYCEYIYITFLKWQNYRNRGQISSCQRL